MLSSTSNSDVRKPNLPYGRIWLCSLVVFVGLCSFSEGYWQKLGFQPSVVDSILFWSMHRNKVYSNDQIKKLVVVGTSRAQLGIDPNALREHFPNHKIVHLAIDGSSAALVLTDLCNDPQFDGLIICDFQVPSLQNRAKKDKEYAYIAFYHERFASYAYIEKRFNTFIEAQLQSHFAIFSPVLTFKTLIYDRLHPTPLYADMQYNRYRPAFYHQRMSQERLKTHKAMRIEQRQREAHTPTDFSAFETWVQQSLKQAYQNLRSKGGDLVLVRMPTTGKSWQLDQQAVPKEAFWDRITTLSGVPTIHFRNDATLASFECPDTSHLDATDAPIFTARLSELIKSKLH